MTPVSRCMSAKGRTLRWHQGGISMIEVLAAMVIFSSSAVILFGWIGQTSARLSKLSTEQRQLFAELAALDFARGINPMQLPNGEKQLQQALTLRWQATPIGDPERVRASPTTPGIYLVQLYKVELTLSTPGVSERKQSIFLPGWRQTSEVRRELPFQYQ